MTAPECTRPCAVWQCPVEAGIDPITGPSDAARISVPFFRLHFEPEDALEITKVLASGHVTTGNCCADFEKRFAELHSCAHAITTSSGSAALHLILAGLGIGCGDVVFVPSLAFAADIQAIEWVGATPVFVDSEPDTLCISPEKLAQTCALVLGGASCRRAVIVVDYGGQMADYEALCDVCRKWDVRIVEDAAHALPAAMRDRDGTAWYKPGQRVDAACFSFYANKPITTGEGGMVITNDDDLAARIRRQRLHGLAPLSNEAAEATWNREVVVSGFKYNLSDLAAAVGLSMLRRVHGLQQQRREVALSYRRLLMECSLIRLPEELETRHHAWHLFPIRIGCQPDSQRRARIVRRLFRAGAQTSVHWRPLHLHARYHGQVAAPAGTDVVDAVWPSLISLPIFPGMTTAEVEFVSARLMSEMRHECDL